MSEHLKNTKMLVRSGHSSFPLLAVVLLGMLLPHTQAFNKSNKMSKPEVCKYSLQSQSEPVCNLTTMTSTTVLHLKKGDSSTCTPTRVLVQPCGQAGDHGTSRKKLKGCRYDKHAASWGQCDLATNRMSKVMTLKSGSSSQCPPSLTKTKSCSSIKKKKCNYIKEEWGPCDPKLKVVTRKLNPGQNAHPMCEPTIQTRPCHRTVQLVGGKPDKCKYKVGDWTPCDLRSNTMTRWMTLKKGDAKVCQKTKKLTKKCRMACKFKRGQWSACNEKTQLTTRVDTLVKGSTRDCNPTREITKKCKRGCKYALGDWGACDPVTNHRTRVKKLIVGGDLKNCQSEEIVTKPCTKKDGEERCFFGPWGDFGPCTNGVRTKHRPVLQGGVECERKGVITKACDDTST